MAKRRQRFAQLEREFRENEGQAEANSRLAGYIDFKYGRKKVKVENRPTSNLLKRIAHGIIPFGLPVGADLATTTKFIVPISVWSDNGRTSLGFSDNELGYSDISEATRNDYFFPALLKVFVTSPQATIKTPRSSITNQEYKRRLGHSYGIPFGRSLTTAPPTDAGGEANTTVDDVDLEDMKAGLRLKLEAASDAFVIRSISFEPERFDKAPKKLGTTSNLTALPTLPS